MKRIIILLGIATHIVNLQADYHFFRVKNKRSEPIQLVTTTDHKCISNPPTNKVQVTIPAGKTALCGLDYNKNCPSYAPLKYKFDIHRNGVNHGDNFYIEGHYHGFSTSVDFTKVPSWIDTSWDHSKSYQHNMPDIGHFCALMDE